MTNTKRADRLLLLILVILAVLLSIVAAVLVPPPREGSPDERPSTFFNAPHGAKAAYLALGKLGFAPRRLRRPIDTDTLADLDALIMLRPVLDLSSYETRVLLDWVKTGRRLLVAPGPPSINECPRPSSLTQCFRFTAADPHAKDAPPLIWSTFERCDDPLLAGIHRLSARAGRRFESNELLAGDLEEFRASPVWSDTEGVIAARIPCGAGMIIALADVYALTNAGLREVDNPLWLANLALELRGADGTGVLAFDEYHAGFPYHAPSWMAIAQLMLAEGWSASVVQTLLVAGLALWAGAVRFGRPRDIPVQTRRQQGEFVRAAGLLLLRAAAIGVAYEGLAAHYRARLCRLLNLDPGADDEALGAALQSRGRADLLATWRASRPAPPSARQLLDFSRRMHRELEALEHDS